MLYKKWICVALLASTTAAVSTSAMAYDDGANTAIGAVAGAVIGGAVGGRNGAIVGGVLGAAVGATSGGYRDDGGYYDRGQGFYAQPAPVYVRPEPVYYQPAPVYYRPAPVYYRPRLLPPAISRRLLRALIQARIKQQAPVQMRIWTGVFYWRAGFFAMRQAAYVLY
jgi:hypothetical protein